MKIRNIEAITVDAGWRPWTFVRVETDDDIVGYGECSVARSPFALEGAIQDLKPVVIGTDPRAYEMRFCDMIRNAIQGPGGVRAKAIAGVELALIDIKAKALGVSVVDLFGGPTRDKVRVYWSHCGTTRALYPEMGRPPLRSMADIAELGREVVRRGYTALKTNIIFPGDPPRVHFDGFGGGLGTTDGVVSNSMLNHIETLIGTFRDAV
ncbi:MAG: mandelate racemase/muconate lactonizing enzyme family protein, partial [Dehalococcoidia bacterium]|nr:mandelate racemase/muconate lactonizing enzyme family protein [Dehalococcoidia bacterium]